MIGRSLASQAYTKASSDSHAHRKYRCGEIDSLDVPIVCCMAVGLKRSMSSLRFNVFRCASMFFVALLAALSALSGRLLEPSSLLRGEQRAHSLLGLCQSMFIATAIEGVPLRISFARPLRFVDSP
jgi:hypothetical protein